MLSTNRTTTSRTTSGASWRSCIPERQSSKAKPGTLTWRPLCGAEKCSVVHETSLFNHIKTDWVGPGKDPKRSIENSWLNVFWKGDLLDVVLVTFTQHCYTSRHH